MNIVDKSDDMNLKTALPHFTIIDRAKDENISFGDLMHLADQMTNEVKNAIQKIETMKADLERMTAQRDQVEAGIKDIKENMKREMISRDAEIEKLRNELQRETAERKATADLLLNSFSQIQSLMDAVKHKDKDLLDIQNLKPQTTQLTSRYRWLKIIGLCLFIGITLYANKEDAASLIDDASEYQIEVISSINEYAEPAYYKVIKDASTKHALDPNLIATMIYVESRGNVLAVSQKGAKGLMQLTPAVYKQYNVGDPFDIEQNIFSGTAYFASLLQRFDGNLELALAAYNCGPTRVIEYKGIPPIKETQEYVERIMEFYLRGEVPTGYINQDS
jgi:soluble lytic murein transglycosylase-like protein